MSETVVCFGISCIQFQASAIVSFSSEGCPYLSNHHGVHLCDSQLFSLKLLWKRATSSNSPKAGSLVLCLMNYLRPGVRQKQQPCIKKKQKTFIVLFMLFYHLEMYKTQNTMHND